ncbi:glycosyltransferase family 1 protein [Coriobacteriales bacterium OH1046]|nr:glycosyltransferase family 1 protein [Coriobacteriales bacterium OH1046]
MAAAIRTLQVIRKMDRGGAETLLMNLLRAIPSDEVTFDFAVHTDEVGDYDEEILSRGGSILRLPAFTGVNYAAYRKACKRLFGSARHYDIVHGHQGSCAAIYLAEAKRCGSSAVAHSHNTKGSTPPLQALAFDLVARPVRWVADYFIGCSRQAGVDRFGERIVESDRFSFLPNGIDSAAFAFSAEARREIRHDLGVGDDLLVGHIGRLTYQKNHVFLLDLFANVVGRDDSAKLLLIGRGELEDEVQQRAGELGLSDRVLMLGVRDDIPAILSAMDIFVLPSHAEGLPLVSIEAQASGLPCLFSEGIPHDAVLSDRARILSLSLGADAWADAVVSTARRHAQDDRRAGMRIVADAGYDIADCAQKLYSIYARLSSRGSAEELR